MQEKQRWALLWFVVALLGNPLAATSASSSIDEDSLLLYAVTVNRSPKQSWGEGAGVYLGQGLVLTAAHVVGMTFWTRPRVIISGEEFSTTTVKEGSFEGVDLTLLSFDDSRLPLRYRLRRTTLCARPPWPGEEVVTIIPGKIARSHVISPRLLPRNTQRFNTVIGDVQQTGNSGSGVFDIQYQCLLGIMSRKISVSVTNPATKQEQSRDVAKYFVPASTIAEFISPNYAMSRVPSQ